MHSLLVTDHSGVVNLSGQGHYLQWGVIQISAANATVILLMIIVFMLALVVPFPGHSVNGSAANERPPTSDSSREGDQS